MYSGYRLEGSSRKRLLQLVKPRYPHVLADHVTHSMRGEAAPDARHIEVLGHLHDDMRGVQVAVVSVDGRLRRPDGRPYHVTISIDPSVGAKPEHANELVDQGYRKIARPRVRLKGHSAMLGESIEAVLRGTRPDQVLEQLLGESEACPHCGSSKFGIMPPDFETAKCGRCKRNFQMKSPPLPEGLLDRIKQGAKNVAGDLGDLGRLLRPSSTKLLGKAGSVGRRPAVQESDDETDRILGLGKYARRLSPAEQRRQDALVRDFQAGNRRSPAPPEARKPRSERPFRLVVQKTRLGKPGDVLEARFGRPTRVSYSQVAQAVRRTAEKRAAAAGPKIEYDVRCHVCGHVGPVYDGKLGAHGPGPGNQPLCPGSLQRPLERIGDVSGKDPA